MEEEFETAKETLRQGELRVEGILKFSTEIDNKVFKLLSLNMTIAIALLFFLLKTHGEMKQAMIYTSIFAIALFSINIFFLLVASIPKGYKGVGLPLHVFDQEKTLTQILSDSKKRYTARFDENLSINHEKNKWLINATCVLAFSPIMIGVFYIFCLGEGSF